MTVFASSISFGTWKVSVWKPPLAAVFGLTVTCANAGAAMMTTAAQATAVAPMILRIRMQDSSLWVDVDVEGGAWPPRIWRTARRTAIVH